MISIQLSKEGKITGPITIDENGRRQFFKLKIIDVRPDENVEIGYWDPKGLHTADNEKERESYLYKSIEQKKFKISTKLVSNLLEKIIVERLSIKNIFETLSTIFTIGRNEFTNEI